jgi:nucleoside-diphosphate-sugar epimerase
LTDGGLTLMTGADGYLGRRLVQRFADEGHRLVLAVRAGDRAELEAKRAVLQGCLDGRSPGSVDVVPADLTAPDPFSEIGEQTWITRIVHAAAITRFNVPEGQARAVNVEGTAKLVELARRCQGLERFGLLSTVYASGLTPGVVDETRWSTEDGFANFYEWSKRRAEEVAAAADLPLTTIRVATAIADDESGVVTKQNAVHNTLRLYFYGLLSLMPGNRDTPVYFVTRDSVADAVVRLMDDDVPLGEYHVCHERAATATLGELVDLAFDEFERHEAFVRRRILRPLFCAIEAFDDLVAASRSFRGSPVNQALETVSPFARQLYVHKDVRNGRLRMAWPAYAAPDPRELISATTARLVETRWGRAPAEAAAHRGP